MCLPSWIQEPQGRKRTNSYPLLLEDSLKLAIDRPVAKGYKPLGSLKLPVKL